jgi:anti-sigma factor RsiW
MTQQDMIRMDAYINGELSAEEKNRFEARLASDAQFAADFEEQKFMRNVLFQYYRAKKTLAESRAQLEAEGFFEQLRREEQEADAAAAQTKEDPTTVVVTPARRERPWYVYAYWTVLALIAMLLLVFFADLIRHVLS